MRLNYKFVPLYRKRYNRERSTFLNYQEMNNQETVINHLQETLSGVIAGAQQHFMHATINKHGGFNKLGDRMLQESAKESEHTQWLRQQLDLIKSIGLQNYLASQV